GVINILTGHESELATHMSSHMDIKALVYWGKDNKMIKKIQTNAADNLKRIFIHKDIDFYNAYYEGPELINELQEVKTTWHPIESGG
ncbi:MAG: aldehyde dehydrogenase, partial [Flavobacteriales bacterium]